jgi:hypothetical protein
MNKERRWQYENKKSHGVDSLSITAEQEVFTMCE